MTIDKALRKIMPAGTKAESSSGKLTWSRRGGYAGERSIRATLAKARAIGFVEVDSKDLSVPDGSVIGSGQYYRDAAGNVLYTSTRYGGVAADNFYRLEITPANPPERPALTAAEADQSMSLGLGVLGEPVRRAE